MLRIDSLVKVFIVTFLVSNSVQLQFKINKALSPQCFEKEVVEPDVLRYTYLVTAEKKENVISVFSDKKTKEQIYSEMATEGEFESEKLEPGVYTKCFSSSQPSNSYITFEFFSQMEAGLVIDLAQDKEVKSMMEGVNDLKTAFQEFEKNFKFIVDRRTRHTQILEEIIKSIKNLTLLKIAIVGILGIFQVAIIKRFFGPDKTVHSVKGAFKDGL